MHTLANILKNICNFLTVWIIWTLFVEFQLLSLVVWTRWLETNLMDLSRLMWSRNQSRSSVHILTKHGCGLTPCRHPSYSREYCRRWIRPRWSTTYNTTMWQYPCLIAREHAPELRRLPIDTVEDQAAILCYIPQVNWFVLLLRSKRTIAAISYW